MKLFRPWSWHRSGLSFQAGQIYCYVWYSVSHILSTCLFDLVSCLFYICLVIVVPIYKLQPGIARTHAQAYTDAQPDHCWTWSTSKNFPSSFTSVVYFKQALQFTKTLLRKRRLGSNTVFSAKACLEIQSAFKRHFQCGCANILSTPSMWHVEKSCETEKAKSSFREKNQEKIKENNPKAWE